MPDELRGVKVEGEAASALGNDLLFNAARRQRL